MAEKHYQAYHNDPPCGGKIGPRGYCEKCGISPDMQSTALSLNSVTLTAGEFASLCMLATRYAQDDGEDVIGVLMKNGAFRVLGKDGPIVELSHLIKYGADLYETERDDSIEVERKSFRKKTS